jgi:uncharacterized Zn finger protein (UPF0148 family)
VTYYCPECVVNWWPYQAVDGCCPVCGRGTVRRQEPASDDADERFRAARTASRAALESAERHARFEAYYAERERLADVVPFPVVDPPTEPPAKAA